jgi:hypothetical protein
MLDIHEFISNSDYYKKYKVNDLLFVEYKCLIQDTKTGYWTPNNYFVYVVGGKKKWKTNQNEYILEDGEAIFIKKGAYIAHQYYFFLTISYAIYLKGLFIIPLIVLNILLNQMLLFH